MSASPPQRFALRPSTVDTKRNFLADLYLINVTPLKSILSERYSFTVWAVGMSRMLWKSRDSYATKKKFGTFETFKVGCVSLSHQCLHFSHTRYNWIVLTTNARASGATRLAFENAIYFSLSASIAPAQQCSRTERQLSQTLCGGQVSVCTCKLWLLRISACT